MRPKHHVAKLDFSLASVLISTCGVCTTNTLPSHLGFFYLLTCCFSDKLKCWGPTCSDVCIQGFCTFVQRCITVEHLGKDSSLYVWILGTGSCDTFVDEDAMRWLKGVLDVQLLLPVGGMSCFFQKHYNVLCQGVAAKAHPRRRHLWLLKCAKLRPSAS